METLRNIIFIPQWIAESLVIHKEPLSTVLDVTQLRRFTSNEDLAGIAALNINIGDLLGLDINMSIGRDLVSYWRTHCGKEGNELIESTIMPNVTPTTAREVYGRIINDKASDNIDIDDFTPIDIGSDVSAVILRYGFINNTNQDHVTFKLVESILQILYVYHPHNVIAGTAIGRKYLELLSRQISL